MAQRIVPLEQLEQWEEPLDDKIQRKSGEHHILPPDP
jgi:hypothetical protein